MIVQLFELISQRKTKNKSIHFFIFVMTQIAEGFLQAHEKSVLVGPVPMKSIFVREMKKNGSKFEHNFADLSKQDHKIEVFLTSAQKSSDMEEDQAFEKDRVNLGIVLCPVMLNLFSIWKKIKCCQNYCLRQFLEDKEEKAAKKDSDYKDDFITVFDPEKFDKLSNKKQICLDEISHVKGKIKTELDVKKLGLIDLMEKLLGSKNDTGQLTSMKAVVEELKAIRNREEEGSTEIKKNSKKLTFHPCVKSETADDGVNKLRQK